MTAPKSAVITLTGPTCAGKSTIERELQGRGCGRAISHTTRLPRAGEKQGVDYHFVTDDEYDRMKRTGQFIEVIEFGSRRYAMSKAALHHALATSENGFVAIVVDPHGAAQIRAYCEQQDIPALSVWVDCSHLDQSRRWISRFAGDLVVGKEAVGSYSERLALMLSEEVEWRRNAAVGAISLQWSYHLKLDTSGGHTSVNSLAQQILYEAAATRQI